MFKTLHWRFLRSLDLPPRIDSQICHDMCEIMMLQNATCDFRTIYIYPSNFFSAAETIMNSLQPKHIVMMMLTWEFGVICFSGNRDIDHFQQIICSDLEFLHLAFLTSVCLVFYIGILFDFLSIICQQAISKRFKKNKTAKL